MQKREFLKACASLAGASMVGCAGYAKPVGPRPRLSETDVPGVWDAILGRLPPELSVLANDPANEVQIVYTPVRRVDGKVQIPRSYTFGVVPERWYPANGMASLPLALLAAQNLGGWRLDLDTAIELEGKPGGVWAADEPAAEKVSRSLRRIFAVDEPSPYNRLFDFLGTDDIYDGLSRMGYANSRLIAHLGGDETKEVVTTRGGRLVSTASNRTLTQWRERQGREFLYPYGQAMKGKAWTQANGQIVQGPHDFTRYNFLPLQDLHDMLVALIYPETAPAKHRWAIPTATRNQLLSLMQTLPRGSTDPGYGTTRFADGYSNYLVIGDSRDTKPDSLSLIGKSGKGLGHVSDVRYIRDANTGVECFIGAVIYCNNDGGINDERYDYSQTGIPFLAALGRAALAATPEM
ncbi:hypothetical protein [Hydrocarboniphaga sp.]|uniref:hypothetical protein n=1 Tax=Hydrocarboniphaga sp. TaxID=2033016 RepID=UPI003D12D285